MEKTTWNAKVSFPGFGTTAGTAAEGNDVRLSDARTPLAHNQAWSTITTTPTTLSGYGITDAQGSDADLTALAGLSANGLIARTGSGTAAARTITGTANQVIVTNGDGVAGNPSLSLPQSIATTSTPQFSRIGIGSASLSNAGIYLTSADTGGPSVYSIYAAPNIKSDVTTRYSSITTAPSTQAAAFNLATLYHFFCTQGAVGAGSTIGEQCGFVVSSGLTGAANNFAFRSAINAGTGRWNLYMDGTAVNYLAGSLGLGVGAPTAQFHTTGTVRFAGFGAGTLVTDSSGNVTASSDSSLKTVTGPFTRGLADVLKLTPRTYRWNEKSGMDTEDENVGFIAQEVIDAVPEAVGQYRTSEVEVDGKKTKKREKAELLTLSDRPLIAALVNAVKELKAENDALSARIAKLEGKK